MERNLYIIKDMKNKKTTKPMEYVRVYDNLIQAINDIRELKDYEYNKDIVKLTKEKEIKYRSYRAYYAAIKYILLYIIIYIVILIIIISINQLHYLIYHHN